MNEKMAGMKKFSEGDLDFKNQETHFSKLCSLGFVTIAKQFKLFSNE